MSPTVGSTQVTPARFQPAPRATLMICSLVLSKSTAAAAPAIGFVACELMLTVKVLPVVVVTVGGLMLSEPVPAANAVAGTSTEATRNIAPADRAASLDRFT